MITRLGEVGEITRKLPPPSLVAFLTEGLVAVRMHGNQAFGKWVQRHAAAPRVVGKKRSSQR
ncbi:hypothetical protein [Cephaloticoccus capnophilus]|uniref:hypothetical protein n=1 Tax=Cephaloticoccus capnophilus TaxID=1548208 RepID=UPI0012E7167B|nr:hypothetical protein [Cephaloticoccus capnophilus]